jgi:hypothetical protein
MSDIKISDTVRLSEAAALHQFTQQRALVLAQLVVNMTAEITELRATVTALENTAKADREEIQNLNIELAEIGNARNKE